jgi:hypothetical protein
MGILSKIREKSESQKKIISLVTAIILTLIIVVVWFSFGSNSSGDVDSKNKLSSLSPFQTIKDEFKSIFSNSQEKMSALLSSSTDGTSTDNILVEELSSSTTAISTDIGTSTKTETE